MKKVTTRSLVALLLLLAAGSGRYLQVLGAPAPQQGSAAASASTPRDWPKAGGNLFNQNYSSLTRINRETVAGLKAVWRVRLGGSGMNAKYSGEAQPAVQDGVVYIVTGADDVFAISVKTGEVLWRYKPTWTTPSPLSVVAGPAGASP